MASLPPDIEDPSRSARGPKRQPAVSTEAIRSQRKRPSPGDHGKENAKVNRTDRGLSAAFSPPGHGTIKSGPTVTPSTVIDQDTTTNDTVNIATEGDLLVIVGPHARRLRVYSLFLENCSCTLKQIINSAKRSSVSIKTKNLEIALPADDGDAFEVLCRHIHQANASSLKVTVKLAEEVALLAKKYECIDSFVYAADYWLRNLSEPAPKSGQAYWNLVVTALVFKNAEWFRKYSFRLLNSYHGSFLAFTAECHDQLLGTRLALALEERRNSMVGHKGKLGVDPTQWGMCLQCFLAADNSFARKAGCKLCLELPKKPLFSSPARISGNSPIGYSSTPGTSTALPKPNRLFAGSNPGGFPAPSKNPFTGI